MGETAGPFVVTVRRCGEIVSPRAVPDEHELGEEIGRLMHKGAVVEVARVSWQALAKAALRVQRIGIIDPDEIGGKGD